MNDVSRFGAIAQLVEHLHGMQGVSGSSPLGSIYFHNKVWEASFHLIITFVISYDIFLYFNKNINLKF